MKVPLPRHQDRRDPVGLEKQRQRSPGPPLPCATVTIGTWSTITSSAGTFSIANIAPGTYTLTISKTGYVTRTVTGFVVSGNRTGLVFYLLKATVGLMPPALEAAIREPVTIHLL